MPRHADLTVFDITEKIAEGDLTSTSTLGETITNLQIGKTFACPKCEGTGGFPDTDTTRIICDICQGFGKTEVAYESYSTGTAYRLVTP